MKKNLLGLLSALLTTLLLIACGGGGGSSAAGPTPTPTLTPTPTVTPTPMAVQGSSYLNAKTVGVSANTLPIYSTARTYADFQRNGELMLFTASLVYDASKPLAEATAGKLQFWKKKGTGWSEDTTLLSNSTGCIHPRKAIVADFNADSRPDVFVACHGYDASPFPGEQSILLLSQGSSYQRTLMPDVAFAHSAAASDIDGDGNIDIAVIDANGKQPFVYRNDGSGNFTRTASLLPTLTGQYFTLELLDINSDGHDDLFLAGNEYGGTYTPTVIYLNSGSGFASATPITLPATSNYTIALDVVFLNGTLYLNRTDDNYGTSTFYTSRVIQAISWPSLNSSIILNQTGLTGWPSWVDWIYPYTSNGHTYLICDNALYPTLAMLN